MPQTQRIEFSTRMSMRETWKTRDGTEMELRPIQHSDADLLMAFVKCLSFGTRYFRYGRGNFELREEEIQRVCHPDPERCVHLLVLMRTAGRVDDWRGGDRCDIAVSAPFGSRCPTSHAIAPFPVAARRTGRADLPHPALGQDFTPSPMPRHAQTESGARDRSARRGARVDTSRPCVA